MSKTIEKAVERQFASMSAEDKDLILKEMFNRYLEKLNVYYHDDMICHKPLVRLNGREDEKPSFRDRDRDRDRDRRGAGSFGGGPRSRSNRPSQGGFKGKPKPKSQSDWKPAGKAGHFAKPVAKPVAKSASKSSPKHPH